MSQSTDLPTEPVEDLPIYWFLRLERGDHAAAAQAQHELDRLGVRVAYGRPRGRPARKEAVSAAS